jgi:hypothetical protein
MGLAPEILATFRCLLDITRNLSPCVTLVSIPATCKYLTIESGARKYCPDRPLWDSAVSPALAGRVRGSSLVSDFSLS